MQPVFLPFRFSGCRLAVAALAALFALVPLQSATAQQTSCERMAREMRALQANAEPRSDILRRQAQRTANQALKITQEMKNIGCDKSRFLIFGSDPPAQCAAMQTRVDQLSRRVKALITQAERAPADANPGQRLAQLASAFEARGCNNPQQSASAETPLPALDGVSAPKQDPDNPVVPISENEREARAASYAAGQGAPGAICVRLCDGFFFPLSGARSRAAAGDMCQAQCPAAETAVYFRRGDNIATAFSVEGKSYSSLPNAFVFQKTFNPDCGCKQQGQTWAEALAPAETLVSARGKPDLIVDQQTAAQWARIQTEMANGKGKKDKEKKVPAEEPPETTASADADADVEPVLRDAPLPAPPAGDPPATDALGGVIEEIEQAEDQPLPPAIIDPADGGRETVIQLLDTLPVPDGQ